MPAIVYLVPSALLAAGLIMIGVVLAPRVGAGRGRLWAGLVVLIAAEVISRGVTPFFPYLYDTIGAPGVGLFSLVVNVVGIAGLLAGVALLASAAVKARGEQQSGFYDPNRPGSAPGYPTGPPAPGRSGEPGPPGAPGGSPYVG